MVILMVVEGPPEPQEERASERMKIKQVGIRYFLILQFSFVIGFELNFLTKYIKYI